MHNAVLGKKNPNYGHKWTLEKRQQFSAKLKAQNHSKGIKNPNYGKCSDNAKNGKTVYMYDSNFNLIKGHYQLNKAIKEKIIYKQYYWNLSLLNV